MRLIVEIQAVGDQFLQLDFGGKPFEGSSTAATTRTSLVTTLWSTSTFTAATGTTIVATRTTLLTIALRTIAARWTISARFAAMAMLSY